MPRTRLALTSLAFASALAAPSLAAPPPLRPGPFAQPPGYTPPVGLYVAQPPPDAPPPRARDGACSAAQVQAVERQRASVVRVASGGMHLWAMATVWGVVYPTPRHVVTLKSVLGVGRAVQVTTASGEQIPATPVASLDDNLVLLELDRPVDAPPVALAESPADLGDALIVLQPGVGGPSELRRSSVTSRAGGWFRADGAQRQSAGLPAFDCDGRLLGLGSGRFDHAFFQAELLRGLASRPREEIEAPGLSVAHFSTGMLLQIAPERAWIGLSMGGAVTAHDRLQLRLSGAILGAIPTRKEQDAHDKVQGVRPQLEASVGYRALLTDGFPVYLVPSVGLTTSWDFIRIEHDLASMCSQKGICGAAPAPSESIKLRRTRPTLGLQLLVGPMSFGYSVQTGNGEQNQHQISFGAEF